MNTAAEKSPTRFSRKRRSYTGAGT